MAEPTHRQQYTEVLILRLLVLIEMQRRLA